MAYNWGAIEQQKSWSTEDQRKYAENKKKWDSSADENEKALLNAENTKIRNKYGVVSDEYGAEDANNAFVYNSQSGNPYMAKADNIDFNVDKSGLENAKSDLENFSYNPENDATFKQWQKQYQNEGASAAKSTLNQLNAANMGRNSSYSSAAAAQVQQAYAQKISDKALELADEAYQKLLDKYNIEKAEYDDAYAKKQDEYNRYTDSADRAMNRWATAEQLDMTKDEHKQNMVAGDLQNQYAQKELDWYDKNAQAAYDQTLAQTEGQNIDNALGNKELEWYDRNAQADLDNTRANTAGIYSGINVDNAQAANYNAKATTENIDNGTYDGTSDYTVQDCQDALLGEGYAKGGFVTVYQNGSPVALPISVAAQALYNGRIKKGESDKLEYAGG